MYVYGSFLVQIRNYASILLWLKCMEHFTVQMYRILVELSIDPFWYKLGIIEKATYYIEQLLHPNSK